MAARGDKEENEQARDKAGLFLQSCWGQGQRPTHPLGASRMGSLWPMGLLV